MLIGPTRWTAGLVFAGVACLVVLCLPWPATASEPVLRFAVITDYGKDNPPEADVAALVKAWNPDFIVTAGDNNQGSGWGGTPEGIDPNVGQYYSDYIGNYQGAYGPGSETNRFFPAMGNHDYNTTDGYSAFTDYFTLPGNERYYDFAFGPARFFVLNCASLGGYEPDGISRTSVQAMWLHDTMGASTSPWNFVILHDSPYTSSDRHGSNPEVQWPYGPWGADAVVSGHVHVYERLEIGGLTYLVAGVGGDSWATFGTPIPGSIVQYTGDQGAMLVEVGTALTRIRYYTRTGLLQDDFTLVADGSKWLPAGSGPYHEAANWGRGQAPNAIDAVANFLDDASGTVTVDAPVALGTINFLGAGAYTLAGPATVTLQASEGWPYGGWAQVSAVAGAHTITAPLVLAGRTRLDAQTGALTLAGPVAMQGGAVLAVTGT
ncbi:MAG: metallophosphoesterase, partial [Acidobacteria bacterium]|nr:metallophosphoesterase [Acidobacteriota bacterium]